MCDKKLTIFAVLSTVILAILLPVRVATSEQQERPNRQATISNLTKIFGSALPNKPNLFVVNKDFVAKINFDNEGAVSSILIFPSFYINKCDSDWKEPGSILGLTPRKYKTVLEKITRIQRFGPLREKVDVGIVTNERSEVIERYQDAFTKRSVSLARSRNGHSYYLTRSLGVYFLHKIDGVVEEKRRVDFFGRSRTVEFIVNGKKYLASAVRMAGAMTGTNISVLSAGPLVDEFFECK